MHSKQQSLEKSPSQASLKVQEDNGTLSRNASNQVMKSKTRPKGSPQQQHIQYKSVDSQEQRPLQIDGIGTKQQARKQAGVRNSQRSGTQIQQQSPKSITNTKQINKDSALSSGKNDIQEDNEYDNDDFEKDDLVRIDDPQKISLPQGISKKSSDRRIQDKQTNESTTLSRQGGGSDSNSLLREISIRNNQNSVQG